MNECIRIEHDESAPNAAVELTILHPLPDYDLDEVEAAVPRDVDVMLASQGFHDLVDEARAILSSVLRGGELEVVQLTGAICTPKGDAAVGAPAVHHPGLWLVLREIRAPSSEPMSPGAQARVARVADELCTKLQLG
ncbi:MAG TPA: hypothetical protein VGG55_01055 [Candidatus Acidoferrales bacterium]|jgi:hypothetical protein